MTQIVLADHNHAVGVVDQAAMLLAEQHQLGVSGALDEDEVQMDEGEQDEHEHHEVVDDAQRHRATDQRGEPGEHGQSCGCIPQAEASEALEEDQPRNGNVADLLRNAELCSQGVLLLEEEVVLDPGNQLVTVILLRQPGLVVLDGVTRTASRCGLRKEGEHDTNNPVNDNDKAQEDMKTTDHAHIAGQEGEMNQEARDDQEEHREEVDPMADDCQEVMRLLVVSCMCHLTSPPKDW